MNNQIVNKTQNDIKTDMSHYFPDFIRDPSDWYRYEFTYKGYFFVLQDSRGRLKLTLVKNRADFEDKSNLSVDSYRGNSVIKTVFHLLNKMFKDHIKESSFERVLSLDKALMGQVIYDIQDDTDELIFVTDDQVIVCEVDADMCCYAHIESLEWELDKEKLFPSNSFTIEWVDSKSDEGIQYHSCSGGEGICEFSFYTIYLDKGRGNLEFRSESSGYYSGHLNLNEVFIYDKGFL